MGQKQTEKDQIDKTYHVSHNRQSGQRETVRIRVYRNTVDEMLVVKHTYESAEVVSEFDILDEETVRARQSLRTFPDFVLKAVISSGYPNIEEPDWL